VGGGARAAGPEGMYVCTQDHCGGFCKKFPIRSAAALPL
jgi:hypothetical protein